MITRLLVRNFKNLDSLEVNSLYQITLLGGNNNVGKTSILEALFILHDRLNPEMLVRLQGFRGIQAIEINPDYIWGPIFTNFDTTKEIEISLTRDQLREKLSMKLVNDFVPNNIQISSNGATQIIPKSTSQSQQSQPALNIQHEVSGGHKQSSHMFFNNTSLGFQVDRQTNTKTTTAVFLGAKGRVDQNEDAQRFGHIDVEGNAGDIVDFLKNIEPSLVSLSTVIHGNVGMIYGDVGLKRKIPVNFMGDGVGRLLSIILAISTAKNGILLVDEIENGLHYYILRKMWPLVLSAALHYNCQIIATSHSYECIRSACDSLTKNDSQSFSYARIEKGNDQKLRAKNYDFDSLKIALSNEWEVR